MISVEDLIDAAKRARLVYQAKLETYLREGNRDFAEQGVKEFPSYWQGILSMGHCTLRLRAKDKTQFGMSLRFEEDKFDAWTRENLVGSPAPVTGNISGCANWGTPIFGRICAKCMGERP